MMEGEAGGSPSIAREGVLFSPRPLGHDWVYSSVACASNPRSPVGHSVSN